MTAGTTLYSQPTDSSRLCLTYPQFKFYAQAVIEREGLKKDTSTLVLQLKLQEGIIRNIDAQLGNCQDINVQKDNIIDIKDKDFKNLALKFGDQRKKTRFWKQASLTLGAISLVLLSLVIAK